MVAPLTRDAPVEHQLLGRAPRRDAGLRQDLLQTFHINELLSRSHEEHEAD